MKRNRKDSKQERNLSKFCDLFIFLHRSIFEKSLSLHEIDSVLFLYTKYQNKITSFVALFAFPLIKKSIQSFPREYIDRENKKLSKGFFFFRLILPFQDSQG